MKSTLTRSTSSVFCEVSKKSDQQGWVRFDTIFPGWYEGRVPHIHARISLNGDEQLTTQFYFDEAMCDEVYTKYEPYAQFGKCPLRQSEDVVLASFDSASGIKLNIEASGGAQPTLRASAKIGVKKA